jgi:hypothetical protein
MYSDDSPASRRNSHTRASFTMNSVDASNNNNQNNNNYNNHNMTVTSMTEQQQQQQQQQQHSHSRRESGMIDDDMVSVVSDVTADTFIGNKGLRGPRKSTDSISSDISYQHSHSSHTTRRVQRKNVFEVDSGKNLLNASMLEYIRDACVDKVEADALKEESLNDPLVLVGWQVRFKIV